MKCAIYSRVSTSDQHPENQLVPLRDFAREKGWNVTREYVDYASGGSGDRDQFQRMWTDASRRRFDVLLFWRYWSVSSVPSRLNRSKLQRLTDLGIKYRSYSEGYIDSLGAFGDAVVGILAAVAKQERVRIQERVTAGLARARARGVHLGRPKSKPQCTVEAVQKMRAEGMTLRAIGKNLNCSNVYVYKLLRQANCDLQKEASQCPK